MNRRNFLKALGASVAALQIQPQEALEQLSQMSPALTVPELRMFAWEAGWPETPELEALYKMFARQITVEIDNRIINEDCDSCPSGAVVDRAPVRQTVVEFNPPTLD